MAERLDEERLEILRSWGAGLASDPREELRAAGKAITVLIEEIDRLHVDLWNEKVEHGHEEELPQPEAATTPAAALRERLILKRRPV